MELTTVNEKKKVLEIKRIRNSVYLIIAAVFIFLLQTLTVLANETGSKTKQVSSNTIEIDRKYDINADVKGIEDGMIYGNSVNVNLKAASEAKNMNIHLTVRYRDRTGQISQIEDVEKNVHSSEYNTNRTYSADGIYEISFLAALNESDMSDNKIISFAIDKTPPEIVFNGVREGEKYNSRQELSVNVFDCFAEGLAADVIIAREAENGQTVSTNPEYICQASNNTNIYCINENGKYTISVYAKDACNNEAKKQLSFLIDTASPVIEVYNNGERLNGSNVLNKAPVFSIIVKDIMYEGGSAEIELLKKLKDGTFEKTYTKKCLLSDIESKLALPVKDEGIYVLNVTAVDSLMNKATRAYYFTLDESPPVIAYFSDFNEHYLKSFNLPVNAEKYINDMTNVSYHTYLNEKETSGGNIKKDGKYILQVVAQDEAGNVSEEAIAFIIDNTKPTVIVSGLNTDGDVDKNTDIKLSLFDDEDYFEQVTVNGERVDIADKCKEAYIAVNDYGQYEINVCAKDNADNRVEKTIVTNCKLLSKGPNITELSGNIKKLTKSVPENSVNNTTKKMSQRMASVICIITSFITITLVAFAVFTFVDTNRKQC